MALMEQEEYVLSRMVERAEVTPDGSGLFIGSPRPFMESFGVSSGPLYDAVKRHCSCVGRGKTAKWHIPTEVMARYLDKRD